MSYIRVCEIPGVRAVTAEPSADDLALLADPEYAGRGVTAAEVAVREMLLCHDQYDRYFTRFPKSYLARFAETLPGKSMLGGHDAGSLPLGRFFRAGTVRKREEFPVPVGARAVPALEGARAEIVPGFEPRQRTVNYLHAGFYTVNDPESEPMLRRIDSGVYRAVSIGFRYDDLVCDACSKSYLGDCPHILGRALEGGEGVVTGTFGGNPEMAEAMEGSIVYLGGQPGAKLLRAALAGELDPRAAAMTPYGEDLVVLKEAEALAREHGHARKVWSVGEAAPPAEDSAPGGAERTPPVGGDAEETAPVGATTPDTEDTMSDEDRAALEAAQKRAADAEGARAVAEKAAADADAARQALEPLAAIGRQALTDIKAAILADEARIRALRGDAAAEDPLMVATLERLVDAGDYATLKTVADARKAALTAIPAGKRADAQGATTAPAEEDALSEAEERVIALEAKRSGKTVEECRKSFIEVKVARQRELAGVLAGR